MSDPSFEVLAEGFQFCEAPRADESGTVWFSDLTGGGYHRVRPGGGVETVLPDRIWIGGATLDRGDAVLCGGTGGLVLVDDGAATPVLREIGGKPIVAVNDIEADATGAIYGGTIDFAAILGRGEAPSPGILFRLTPTGELTILRHDVIASNGIGFSPDGGLMYHSETSVGIWAWPMRGGVASGRPSLFAKADDCDGLAVDAEGGIWVAFFSQALLRRYRPDGGIDREIALPFPHVTSLAFGGPGLGYIYVTTGGDAADPARGGIVRLRVDVPGLPTHRSAFSTRG